jgi:hypothetical protein
VLLDVTITVLLAGEEQDRPRMGRSRAAECLEAVVAVFEEVLSVVV